MAKKHWIYIKRGLSESAKHRAQMGECIWLFMHIIDRADWETGVAYDWKDKEEAEAMEMSVDTLRYQRQKLEELDYIRCKKKQHGQDISIMEWKNPKDYGSETKNPRNESSNPLPLSNSESLNQSSNQSLNQLQGEIKTPTSSSISESLINDVNERTALLGKLYSENIGAITPLTADLIRNMAIDYPDATWYRSAFEIAVKNNARNLNYVDAILRGWKDHFLGWKPERPGSKSRPKQPSPAPVQVSDEELERQRAAAAEWVRSVQG